MSVSAVRIVSIIGLLSELDKVIKFCGESQVFHPDNALSFYKNTEKFVPLSDKNPYSAPLSKINEALTTAGKSIKTVDVHNFDVTTKQINDYVDYLSKKLGMLSKEKSSLLQKIDSINNSIKELKHFAEIPVDLKDIYSCEYIKARFGRIPKENFDELNSYSNNPYVLFSSCSSDNHYYWGVYFAPIDHVNNVDEIFHSLNFEKVDVSMYKGAPKIQIQELEDSKKDLIKQLAIIEKKIDAFWKVQYEQCIRFYSKLDELNTYFSIKSYVSKYNNSFILVGWIPIENEDEFASKLKNMFGVEFAIENAENELKFSPPVKLKNKKIFKPFEFFVDMYGLPSYDEIDPTIFVSIVYTTLFGIMFGDVGQGIVLSIAGYLMWKFKHMDLGKILIPCGISSAVFGFVYGSVFGLENLLNGFYNKVFGLSEKPIDVMEPNTTMMILVAAISIGVVLIIISMLLNIISSLKRKNYENALFGPNGLCGLVFYSSLIIGFVIQYTINIKIITIPYIILLIILPLICIVLKGILGKLILRDKNWKPESLGDYLLENIFEIFEVLLSYLSNTISFLRVGAYVLVHAGMMLAVSALASMTSGLAYIIIFVIGNILVISLEGLLVGIQVLRLNFYEIFSRFFEGEGRPFNPITIKKV